MLFAWASCSKNRGANYESISVSSQDAATVPFAYFKAQHLMSVDQNCPEEKASNVEIAPTYSVTCMTSLP